MKTLFDLTLAIIIFIIFFIPIILLSIIIFLQDFKNPYYVSTRIGKNSKKFKMFKFRSMVTGADKNNVFSTSDGDTRVTLIGSFIRKYKLDEIPQIFNVLAGQLSLVGPRPNVEFEVNKYSESEKKLLDVKPGITDFASIIFSDEGEILKDSKDPNNDYEILIRPFKSMLGLKYIEYQSLFLDLKIIVVTLLSLFNKKFSYNFIYNFFLEKGYDPMSLEFILRKKSMKNYDCNRIFLK